MAFGFGSTPSFASGDDQSSISPALQAWLQDRQAQQPQAAPAVPATVDSSLTQRGLPTMSSVINGMVNGATGDANAAGGFGSRIGSMLGDMVGRTGDLIGKFRDGAISPTEFLTQAATRAGQAAYAPVQFSQDFRDSKIDPRSDEAIGGALGMAGMAMTGGLGGAAVKQGETVLGAGPIRAYHGSPHDFDKFNMSAIGSGEGAQAYGHGLYFASNEGVARSYRDALRADPAIADSLADLALQSAGGDRGVAIKDMKRKLYFADDPDDIARYTSAHDLLASGQTPHIPQGHMYEVGIKADPSRMLDYDAPIAGQSAAVQRFAKRAGIEPQTVQHLEADPSIGRYGSGYGLAPTRGGDLINALKGRGYDPAELSLDMRAKGIPGVRYLDQGSRFVGEGTHNYVTFSDDIVSILRKYGLAGLIGGGAAAGALNQNQNGGGS